MSRRSRKIIKKTIHWVLVAYILFYILTGFGITDFQTVEPLTLGLMGKAAAMQLHNNMEIPFAVLIGIHVVLSLIMKDKQDPTDEQYSRDKQD